MMNMHERIMNGLLFTDNCEGMPEERLQAKLRMKAFNESSPTDVKRRLELLADIFGGPVRVWIEPPFYFCYGRHIEIGPGTYLNFNCNFVDDGKIVIGEKVLFGPAVTIATVGHPLDPEMRQYMYTAPVVIGDRCWIGANVTICPGVTIGPGSVIGAGSVVVKDIPENVIAVGNPCRVVRSIDEHDKLFYFRDRRITAEDLAEENALRKG